MTDLQQIERTEWAQFLEEGGCNFDPERPEAAPYVVIMPAPNLTGALHIGHGLSLVMQDTIVRYRRLQGYNVHYAPGLDHAGSRMEKVVRHAVELEGLDWTRMDREERLARCQEWARRHHTTIIKDLQAFGIAANWSEVWFSLDEKRNKVVEDTFLELYRKGLIYRAEGITNWCVEAGMPIPHDWLIFEEEAAEIFEIRLAAASELPNLLVWHPEFLLGAAAVAISSSHPRASALQGTRVVLPVVNRDVPVMVVDDTGAPEHASLIVPGASSRDYELAKARDLPIYEIYTLQGLIDAEGTPWHGCSIESGRAAIVSALAEQGHLVDRRQSKRVLPKALACPEYQMIPKITTQWYLRVNELSKSTSDMNVRFNTKKWKRGYQYWLQRYRSAASLPSWWDGGDARESRGFAGNRDWLLSSQLTWGQRMPVFDCQACGHNQVNKDSPETCENCGNSRFQQTNDVFEISFTCAQWPRSVNPWTERTDYSDTVVTGHDVYLYWIANSNRLCAELIGKPGYSNVIVHGLIVDEAGEKMTKSKNNTVPLVQVVEQRGIEVMRAYYYLVTAGKEGDPWITASNAHWEQASVAVEQLYHYLRDTPILAEEPPPAQMEAIERVATAVHEHLERGSIGLAYQGIMDYWHQLKGTPGIARSSLHRLLRILHPFHPFISDHIFRNRIGGKRSLSCGTNAEDNLP